MNGRCSDGWCYGEMQKEKGNREEKESRGVTRESVSFILASLPTCVLLPSAHPI